MEEKDRTGLHNLGPPEGSRKNRKRVGRGRAAGGGKTCGRGTKGQKSRSGSKSKPGFEGGQMPLVRRVPKIGGFKPRRRTTYSVVNLFQLDRKFSEGDLVEPASLVTAGLIKKDKEIVKVLGDGELSTPLTVRAHAFSRSAMEKIESAGVKAEVI